MKMVCGLGNPGKEYENTRHNVGFMVVDHICDGEKFKEKFNGLYLKKNYLGEEVIFVKPLSYMNLSGEVVRKYADYYDIPHKNILVIRDDLDLEIGHSRIKFDSSSGGDNGVKSIISCLGDQKFYQYKIGISNNKNIETKDYVLGKFSKEKRAILDKVLGGSKEVIDKFVEEKYSGSEDYYFGEK